MGPRVAYWNNIPAPYVADRFDAVASRGNIDFEAWFSYRTEPDRSWEVDESTWRFPHRFLPTVRFRGRTVPFPAPLVGRDPPQLLVSLYGWPWFVVGWWLARRRGARVAWECEVTSDAWVRRTVSKERAKHHLFPRLDGVIAMGEEGAAYARRYGADPARMVFVPHSFDVRHFAEGRASALPRRSAIRVALALRGTTFLYVGRLWAGKGLDVLLDAYGLLQRSTAEPVSLLLVGDGQDEARLRRRCRDEGLANVVFAGFRQKRDLPELYAASDVFVFPTLGDPYGLVVEEAMASSLPVIASSAAGEIRSRIEDGANGYIVPPHAPAELSERMRLLLDGELRLRLGASGADRVAGRTPEAWAETFERAVERIMSRPRAR